MFIISGFYAFEEIFRVAEEELEDQKLRADAQLDVDLKTAASRAFGEARLLVEETSKCLKTPAPDETEYFRILHFSSPKVIKLIKILQHSAEELRPETDGEQSRDGHHMTALIFVQGRYSVLS